MVTADARSPRTYIVCEPRRRVRPSAATAQRISDHANDLHCWHHERPPRSSASAGTGDRRTTKGGELPTFRSRSLVEIHLSVISEALPPRLPSARARRGNRKGVAEKANHTAAQAWWRTLLDDVTIEQARASLDRFCATMIDTRRRVIGEPHPNPQQLWTRRRRSQCRLPQKQKRPQKRPQQD